MAFNFSQWFIEIFLVILTLLVLCIAIISYSPFTPFNYNTNGIIKVFVQPLKNADSSLRMSSLSVYVTLIPIFPIFPAMLADANGSPIQTCCESCCFCNCYWNIYIQCQLDVCCTHFSAKGSNLRWTNLTTNVFDKQRTGKVMKMFYISYRIKIKKSFQLIL